MAPSAQVAASVVRTAAGKSIETGMWTLVGVVVTTIGLIAIAYIKQRGPWKQVAINGTAGDFARLREEIAAAKADARQGIADAKEDARAEIAEAKSDAKAARDEARRASDIAQRLENMVACMRPAISILTAEVKRLDPGNPNNPALVQVADLMAMAAAGDLGLGKAMVELSTMRGTGE